MCKFLYIYILYIMKKSYILFIDSGIGGLSTLAESMKSTKYNYLYFADNLNCPYGKHSKKKIYNLLKNIINKLKSKYNLKIIVLACNTATTTAITLLRNTFKNLTFIGTEPAINLANKLGYKNILCIATPTTIKQDKYKLLIKSCNFSVKSLSPTNFASQIEEYLTLNTLKSKLSLLKTIFYIKSKCKNIDCIILGCTHYVLIQELIQKYINLPLINGNYGVSKTIRKHNEHQSNKNSSVKILLSNNTKYLNQKYIKILKQILAK